MPGARRLFSTPLGALAAASLSLPHEVHLSADAALNDSDPTVRRRQQDSTDRPLVCPRPLPASSGTTTRLPADDPNGRDFHEVSGLAVSPTQVGPSGDPVLFLAADGPRERIGLFDSGTGERLLTVRMPNDTPESKDWESLAIGPCGAEDDAGTCLYVADVGDNTARNSRGKRTARDEDQPYRLYRIHEPRWEELDDNDRLPSSDVRLLPIDYLHESSPTDSADCEAIFVDHVGWGEGGARGDVYLLTKWNSEDYGKTRLYKIPPSAWGDAGGGMAPLYSPAVAGDYGAGTSTGGGTGGGILTSRTWTGADMSLDGTVLALGDYYRTYLFLRCPGQSVAEALVSKSTCASWVNPDSWDTPQWETVAFTPDGAGALQLSECYGCDSMPLKWTDLQYDEATTLRSCPAPTSAETDAPPSAERTEPSPFPSPTLRPSVTPTKLAPNGAALLPSRAPVAATEASSSAPSSLGSGGPTTVPTGNPTSRPPSEGPTSGPTTASPSASPSATPGASPSAPPSEPPGSTPSAEPSDSPGVSPTAPPSTSSPTAGPTGGPSAFPADGAPSPGVGALSGAARSAPQPSLVATVAAMTIAVACVIHAGAGL